jgi:hypothetical protein
MICKIKVEKCGKFSPLENSRSTDHNSPHIHHDFTIKTPPKRAVFPRTSSKKRPQTLKEQVHGRSGFFWLLPAKITADS